MQKIDGANRIYACGADEQVTMTFVPSDPDKFRVEYSFTIPHGPTQTATEDKIVFTMSGDEMVLETSLIFTGTDGDCTVKLGGSLGGNFTHTPKFYQIGTTPQMVTWRFRAN